VRVRVWKSVGFIEQTVRSVRQVEPQRLLGGGGAEWGNMEIVCADLDQPPKARWYGALYGKRRKRRGKAFALGVVHVVGWYGGGDSPGSA